MIKEYIQKHLKKKLASGPSLVIYDPELFYRDLVMELEEENLKVFDGSRNVVFAREEALNYWVQEMPNDPNKKLMVYVPFKRRENANGKTRDPFSFFGEGGACFPDQAADEYEQLCIAAIPDREEKIKEYFRHEKFPSFESIDALKGGNAYPRIKNGLGVSSESEILLALLAPSSHQLQFLESDKTWAKEFRQFLKETLGVSLQKKSLTGIQEELWLVVLFSEFVHDLPIELPAALSAVPVTKDSSEELVKSLCNHLRNRKDLEELYIRRANKVSQDLSLPARFKNEEQLGTINTFAFEDSTFYLQFKAQLIAGNLEEAESYVKKSSNSIWTVYDDGRRTSWLIAKKATGILRSISELEKDFKKVRDINEIITWYSTKGFHLDTLHRELDKSVTEMYGASAEVQEVHKLVVNAYLDFMDKVQHIFLEKLEAEGIPNITVQRNLNLFDAKVEPLVKSGKKTVYILADALRFELADQLSKGLSKSSFDFELEPTLAFIPSVTKYAMAALMPRASKALELHVKGASLEPFLDGIEAGSRDSRIKYMQQVLGDKAVWAWEKDVLSGNYEKADLLVVTTTEVDQAGENSPDNAQFLIEKAITKILKLSSALKEAGYEEFILAADHGFVLLDQYRAGNKCDRPIGDWKLKKSRCVAGIGNKDDNHIELHAQDLGVKSEVDQFLFLKNYATYERGKQFFHEGLSLQEIITPCLTFRPKSKPKEEKVEVNLTYRGKTSGTITTLRPSLELATFGGFFGETIDIAIEAVAGDKIVGEPAPSEVVNSTTGHIEIHPGDALKFSLAMNEDFEGKFTVYAKLPASGVILSEITLETDYL